MTTKADVITRHQWVGLNQLPAACRSVESSFVEADDIHDSINIENYDDFQSDILEKVIK